ncbi:MAG TPA: mechanosensitive ion channel [Anaerohalosphaeraceae bacterium]|jgi:small conductance mechanosensitive channel|nr:MAG: Small-conductance mechanosensitive channel [Planctomycetes bacterium ADurb.Bin126]HPY77072.1 mechanosensitive ion channel [Anaerohalosphaeraceae bacterium]
MEQMWDKIIEYLTVNGVDLLWNLVAAALIFLIGRWLARLATLFVNKVMEKGHVDPTLRAFIKHLLYSALLLMVIVAALTKILGDDASKQFVAVIGAAGLAVGFALQGSLSNFAAGIILILFKPFRVGDFVEIAGTSGKVQEIQIFNTVLNSIDNTKIIIPNAQITGGNIRNYTANETRRVDLTIRVSYRDDLKTARGIIERVLAEEPRILPEPAPLLAVSQLTESSVNFLVCPWVKGTDYWSVLFALNEKLKVALEEGGCTIPFPQQDVHIRSKEIATV